MTSKTPKILLAISAVALLLTLAVSPMMVADDEASAPAIQQTGAPIWIETMPQDIRNAISGPFFDIGNFFYAIGNDIAGTTKTPGGNQSDVNQYAREVEATNTCEKIIIISKQGAALIDNDAQTWKLTELNINRAAEIAAGGSWSDGIAYDADGVLTAAGIYSLLSTGNGNTQHAMDWAFDIAGNKLASGSDREPWSSNTVLSSMKEKIIWNGGSTSYATSQLLIDFGTIVTADSTHNLVYIDADYSDGKIYAMQAGSLTSSVDGKVVSLSKGENAISGLKISSGWYTLSPGAFSAPALPSMDSERSAICVGGVMIVCDDALGYAVLNADGGLDVTCNGTTVSSTTLQYSISYGGTSDITNADSTASVDPIVNAVRAYSDYISELKDRLASATQAGRVMWSISSVAHKACTLLSPSSVIPQLENMKIDDQQAYAIYVAALDQIAQYNDNYGSILAGNAVTISAESLKLYCHGTVYNSNGTAVATGIFTPYVYVNNMTVATGEQIIFDRSGIVMFWDESGTALSAWEGTATESKLVTMQPGTYFMADSMIYNGQSASTVELQVKTIKEIGIEGDGDLATPTVPTVLDASKLLAIIVIELGAIIALLGWTFRSPVIIIIGAIVVVLGVFCGSAIAAAFIQWRWLV